jgi:hypothetical protein
MTFMVIGYGPKTDSYPVIPDYLIIQCGDSIQQLMENGDVLEQTPPDAEDLISPIGLKPDLWCAVEENHSLSWFNKSNRKNWATDRAMSLVRQSVKCHNPLNSIHLLETAAKLCGIDLTELIQTLESHRDEPDESLTTIFKRLRDKVSR